MGTTPPHLRLFYIRCTVMAFHALMWSFLLQSKPEFKRSSSGSSDADIDKQLNAVVIVGAVFLAILAVFTLIGVTLQSVGAHYFFIVMHGLAILLVIVSILSYWDVKLLWIPTILCCLLPALCEVTLVVLHIVFRD
jgi:hypothetical protein